MNDRRDETDRSDDRRVMDMPGPQDPEPWLAWAREIQSLGQIIQAFARTEYDTANGRRLQEIAADMVARRTGLDAAPLVDDFLSQPGYTTPKIDVRAAAVRPGDRGPEILLVQEAADRRWCLPGGWADVGSVPGDEAARECEEESGYQVRPVKVVGVFDANRGGRPMEFFHAYKLIFLCEIERGEARASHETLAVDFFPLDDPAALPPLSQNRTNARHLEEIRAHVADPSRAAWFD
ncbi:MAG: NUDIX hydrolase N-terminal domain-containing protein [Candidatus Krumholzibacteriia bacterium]